MRCTRARLAEKRDEARHIRAVLDPYCDPTILLFIPRAYRSASGDWLVRADVCNVALFDRLRLLGGTCNGRLRGLTATRTYIGALV